MKWSAMLMTVLLTVSCGSGLPTYLDRVRPLPQEQAHPLYLQLLPVLAKPEGLTPDQLVRTWKDFLGETPRPLAKDGNVTFVYYDFSHQLDKVFLEASFAPDRLEPLTRVGTSSLFSAVYSVPKPLRARYRFSDGTKPLPDPFHPDLLPWNELWHPVETEISSEPVTQWVWGASETGLDGQDLQILLPGGYRRNLATTYPLVVVTGLEGRDWVPPIDQLLREGVIRPVIVVSVGSPTGLKSVLEDKVVPWLRSHYRASPLASDLYLIGWGPSARPAQEVAASRTDFWIKTWFPLADQAQGAEAWNVLAPPFFRTQFTSGAP